MDFKYFNKGITGSVLLSILILILFACSDNANGNTQNTYYVEIINFNDSLKKYVSDNIFGKAAYYKNNKLEIVSLNYLTDNFPDMHYFKNIAEVKKTIEQDTKKIRIEFKGNYSVDSIRYSLQKFKYSNNQWIKISDMGFIKETTTYKRAKEFAISEFGKQIINNTVLYSYN